MSIPKVVTLVIYAVLVALAITQAGTTAGTVSLWIIGLLAAVHLVEVFVLLDLCRRASGSLAGNLFNVFIFGILHKQEMLATIPQE